MGRHHHNALLLITLLTVIIFVTGASKKKQPDTPPDLAQDTPAAPEKPAFVGSETCQACHEDIYNGLAKSPHHMDRDHA